MYLNAHISALKAKTAKSTKNLIRLPAKPKKVRRHEESDLQQAIIQLASYRQNWGGWFHGRLSDYLIASMNGGKRNPREAARLKREGCKAGVADLLLTIPNGALHGLWIELKTEKGRLSEAQKDFFAKQFDMGYHCEVVRSVEEFEKVVNEYLS
jgi:hypothetical protein